MSTPRIDTGTSASSMDSTKAERQTWSVRAAAILCVGWKSHPICSLTLRIFCRFVSLLYFILHLFLADRDFICSSPLEILNRYLDGLKMISCNLYSTTVNHAPLPMEILTPTFTPKTDKRVHFGSHFFTSRANSQP